MLVTILLPELILTHAILELILAVRNMQDMEEAIQLDGRRREIGVKYPTWWVALRARMRRIYSLHRDEEEGRAVRSASTSPTAYTWTLTHAYFANMGNLVYASSPESAEHPLTGMHLARFLDAFQFPELTEAEIKDRSKTDGFVRLFSVLQISYLMLSLIIRRAQGLPVSQLEVLTLAFAVCGVVTYITCWYKPKDVGVPLYVGKAREGTRVQALKAFDSFWRLLSNDIGKHQDHLYRVPNDNVPTQHGGYTHFATYLLAFVSALFSSLHAIAWNFDFPTETERTIWHMCTILTILIPPFALLGIPLSQTTWREGNPREFLYASIRVLRELAWVLDEPEERQEVNNARRMLEAVHDLRDAADRPTKELYKDLLWPPTGGCKHGRKLRQDMLDFVDKKAPFQDRRHLDLPPGYSRHLRQLLCLMDGQGSYKMVEKVARTNVFPRRALPTAFNRWFLYIFMGFYCLARLVLVAVGISSLRAMPEGVYAATWADYIPAI